MNKISKAAEDKLLRAIEKTAVMVNAGTDPSEAIAKAAQEDGIPPGHINLMVHAYNTGRTTRQRQEGKDALEKAADFPLADASRVLELMYPTTVKSAAALHNESAVSTQYALPPTGLLQRREKRAIQQRKLDWGLGLEAPEPYPGDAKRAMQKAFCDADRLQRRAAEARGLASRAFDKMATTFYELTDYFRRPGCTPIPIVRETVTLMHGDKGTQVMDQLIRVTPTLMKLSMHKQAAAKLDETTDGEPYALVSQLLDEVDEYKRSKQACVSRAKEAAEGSEALLRPFVPRPQSVLSEPPYLMLSHEKQGAGSPLVPLAAASMLKNLFGDTAGKLPGSEVEQAYETIADPEHEQELRNIRASAMLQDMLLNDPVIAAHNPDEAMGAYNEIVSMAPRAADQRLIMQSLMRKRLEQGLLDPFEVEQLLAMQEKQHKINQPPKPLSFGDVSILA
jgi:hypothetical protein